MRDGGGVLRTITRIRMRDGSNVLRNIQRIRMRDGANVLRTVWQYFSVVLSTSVVTGSASGAASHGTVTSANVTSTVTGGTGPYTYSWQYQSGDATITPVAPTSSASTFTSDVTDAGSPKIASYALQVTDSSTPANVILSSQVQIQLNWTDTR